MTVSDFLKERNNRILERYRELRKNKIRSDEAKRQISLEFNNLAIPTIEQVLYNRKYSNSPHNEL